MASPAGHEQADAGEARDPIPAEPDPGGILARAAVAGLPLTEAEARGLAASVRRLDAMGAEVRALTGPDGEPSGPALAPWRVTRP
jgi:hypothetical protein